jgi:hypothetical protein
MTSVNKLAGFGMLRRIGLISARRNDGVRCVLGGTHGGSWPSLGRPGGYGWADLMTARGIPDVLDNATLFSEDPCVGKVEGDVHDSLALWAAPKHFS